MASCVAIVIIFSILVCSVSVCQSGFVAKVCGSNGNYANYSIYNKNLDSALANLSSAANTSNSGFYNVSMGQDSNRVNAVVFITRQLFFDALLPPPGPHQLSPPPSFVPRVACKDDANMQEVIIIVVVIVLLVLVCIYIRRRKQRAATGGFLNDDMEDINSNESLQYDFGTVEVATNYFSDSNKLGQGGFGAVYKGAFQNGQEIAVKRLSLGSNQDAEMNPKIADFGMAKLFNLDETQGITSRIVGTYFGDSKWSEKQLFSERGEGRGAC